MGTYKRYK